MDSHAIVLGGSDWTRGLSVLPGAHVAVLSVAADIDGFFGRRVGLELRDTLLVLSAGVTSRLVLLFRKPLEEPTVADQVLATGTGGINVDGSRVRYQDGEVDFDRVQRQQHSDGSVAGAFGAAALIGQEIQTYKAGGRWPPNVLLVHGSGCRLKGSSKIPGHKGYPDGPGGKSRHWHEGAKRSSEVRPDAWAPRFTGLDGTETVPNWDCQADCPVRLLDGQSVERGMHSAGSLRAYISSIVEPGFNKNWSSASYGGMRHGDSGGASRFFPQFRDDLELVAWLRGLIAT